MASSKPDIGPLEGAYEASGDELAGHAKAEGIAWRSGEGITVLCTLSGAGGRERTVLLGLDDDGEERWRREHAEAAGRAIAALPDGGFLVAGEAQRGTMEFSGALLRIDGDGHVIDARTAGESGRAGLNAVAVLDDASALAGGTENRRAWLLAAQGDWQSTIDAAAEVVGLAGLDGGEFALAAIAEPSTTELGMTYVAVLTSDRTERWSQALPGAGRGEPAAIAAMPGGGLILAGHRAGEGAARLWALRVEENGEVAWERELGPEGEEHRGRAVAVLPGGDVAIAGDGTRDGRRRVRVARLAGDGTPAWEVELGDEAEEVARALAATDEGDLLLAGSVTGKANRTRAIVRRLGGDGAVRWTRMF